MGIKSSLVIVLALTLLIATRAQPGIAQTSPSLTLGSVSPASGYYGTTFTFQVTYADSGGHAPSYVRVFIDNIGRDMTMVSGDYTTGALYQYSWVTTSTDVGSHNYHFEASDGISTARDPVSGDYDGPSVVEKKTTSLAISPVAFQLRTENSITLTATLKDNVNNPLVGKTITWGATSGSVTPSSGTTDSNGQVSVTYTAPNHETTVSVTASFAGDNQYSENQASVVGLISAPAPKPESTFISITPTSFELPTGISDTFTATLTSGGQPIAGKRIEWSATAGTPTPSSGYTDSSGRVTTEYYAPDSPVEEVAVVASFAGDSWYEASENSSAGKVASPPAKQVSIQITPSSFSIEAGDSIQLTAIVTSGGSPVEGKLVTWSADAGSFSPQSAYTDAEGKVMTTYTILEARQVTIGASFAGDNAYQAAQMSQQNTVNSKPLYKNPVFWVLVTVGVAGGATLLVLKKRNLLFRKKARYCRKCGAPVPEGVKFCRKCGARLRE